MKKAYAAKNQKNKKGLCRKKPAKKNRFFLKFDLFFFYLYFLYSTTSQPTRRSARTRKAPQRFADEDFETSEKSTDVPINFDVDGLEFFDLYDDAGRLWEVNLVTNEKVLLYDPANFGEVVAEEIQTSNQESKHPDSTITKRELLFKLEAKNCPEVSTVFLRHELENESEFYDEFCQACSLENVIQTLNTAMRQYKKENDITSWKRFLKPTTLKSVQTRTLSDTRRY